MRHCRSSVVVGIAGALAVGVGTLVGWMTGFDPLRRVLADREAMGIPAALSYVLAAIALALLRSPEVARPRRRAAVWIAFALLNLHLIAVLMGGWHSGMWRVTTIGSAGFILIAASLACLSQPGGRLLWLSQVAGLGAMFIGWFGLACLLYGADPAAVDLHLFVESGIPVLGPPGMILVGWAIACARPTGGLVATMTSDYAGGMMARAILPLAMVLPLAIGWVRDVGERYQVWGPRFGSATVAVLNSLCFAAITWGAAFAMNRLSRERSMAEAKTRRGEQRLAMAMAASGMATWHWNAADQSLVYSDTTILGLPRDAEVTHEQVMAMIHPDDRENLYQAGMHSLKTGEPFDVESRLVAPDGKVRWMASRGQVVFDSEGKPTLFEGISYDITQRKLGEEEIREQNEDLEELVAERTRELRVAKEAAETADRQKSQFLAAMSHELRTPLNAILGFTGTLLMGLPGPLNREQRRQLETVRASARHQLSLINDLLDLAKIESGRATVHIEQLDCREVVREVVNTLSPTAFDRNLPLEVYVPAEPVMVAADHRALEQILLNLTQNALKFTQIGSVALRVESDSDRVTIAVVDTGIGISPEDQAKLFQPFVQLTAGHASRPGGSGLGLHLSRKLADLMGGAIRLKSEPGHGSVFTLELPRKCPTHTPPP